LDHPHLQKKIGEMYNVTITTAIANKRASKPPDRMEAITQRPIGGYIDRKTQYSG